MCKPNRLSAAIRSLSLALTLACLAGCQGHDVDASSASTRLDGQTLSLPLPALPPARLSAGVVIQELTGSSAVDQSSNAVGDGSVMKLTPGPGETSWAIYELSFGNDLPLYVDADFVCVDPQNPNIEGAYIALGDYSRNAWEFYGPFGGRHVLALDNSKHKSPGNSFVIAIIQPSAGEPPVEVQVNKLTLVRQHFNSPPIAVLQSDRTMGNVPCTVRFDAANSSDPDGNISRYLWDFNGNGVYESSSSTPNMNHVFEEAGIIAVRMAVEDADGERTTASATIDVNVADNIRPVADLISLPASGDAPLEVTLNAATGSIDPDGSIVRFDWDFDGDGEWDHYDGPAVQNHYYADPGNYPAKVRITDNSGAQCLAEVQVEVYAQLAPIQLDEFESAEQVGSQRPGLAIVNGKPAVSYVITDKLAFPARFHLRYIPADNTKGTDWLAAKIVEEQYSPYEMDHHSSLVEYAGRPLISYALNTVGPDTGQVRLWWADDSQLSDWTYKLVTPQAGKMHVAQLMLVGAQPGIICHFQSDNFTTGNHFGLVEDTQPPDMWDVGEWHLADNQTLEPSCSMALVSGRPALAFVTGNDLYYARANTAGGSTWNEPVLIYLAAKITPSLAVVDGKPAVAFVGFGGADKSLLYLRASDTLGGVDAWENISVLVAAESEPDSIWSIGPQLKVIGGHPAVVWSNPPGGAVRYAVSSSPDGEGAFDWSSQLVDSNGFGATLLEVDSGAGIAYFRDNGLYYRWNFFEP